MTPERSAECLDGLQVEVRMKKAAAGTWPSLEERGANAPANWSSPTAPPLKVYPSSRPQVRRVGLPCSEIIRFLASQP